VSFAHSALKHIAFIATALSPDLAFLSVLTDLCGEKHRIYSNWPLSQIIGFLCVFPSSFFELRRDKLRTPRFKNLTAITETKKAAQKGG